VLEELRIRGLGVIDAAALELGPGFTAVTGETGAGKTMVLTGLGLLLGGRSDSGLVRAGEASAQVEGRIRIDTEGSVAERAAEAGADLDGDSLIVGRSISAEGRSRAFLGGRSVPAAVLAELADGLVAVHGQADQRGLLRPSVQRGVLDRYGGETVEASLATYRRLFAELSAIQAELTEVTARSRERAQEADLLRFGLNEIAAVAPLAGEDATLRAEIERLAHVDALRRAADDAHAAVSGGDDLRPDVLTRISTARQALAETHGRDEVLDGLEKRLAEAAYLLADVGADLAAYSAGLEADPVRLEAAQQRLAALGGLVRKYAPDIDGVRQWSDDAAARLADLDGDDGRVETLTAEQRRLLGALAEAALALSAGRRAAALRLETAVSSELAALAMPHAAVRVDVRQRESDAGLPCDGRRLAFGPAGVDEVELQLIAYPGATPRPLDKGASGGELSRLMLALEVVLAGSNPVPTFVFDEVDAGIGGQAAVEVGRRLAALARTAQVIVVTHLPQVAAFADNHLVVRKTDDSTGASTVVAGVTGAERLEELSRMLSGLPESELGRGHAEELLQVASAYRAD
jgi:DNA repair protein RecN (Recombination protein N)